MTTAEEEQAQTRLLLSSALDLVVLVRPAVRLRGTGELQYRLKPACSLDLVALVQPAARLRGRGEARRKP